MARASRFMLQTISKREKFGILVIKFEKGREKSRKKCLVLRCSMAAVRNYCFQKWRLFRVSKSVWSPNLLWWWLFNHGTLLNCKGWNFWFDEVMYHNFSRSPELIYILKLTFVECFAFAFTLELRKFISVWLMAVA